jgi:hypothetical protein
MGNLCREDRSWRRSPRGSMESFRFGSFDGLAFQNRPSKRGWLQVDFTVFIAVCMQWAT